MASSSSFVPVQVAHLKQSAFSQREKTIVLNVHDALIYQDASATVRDVVTRCSNMTGVSERSIYRFLSERKQGNVSEPKKHVGKKSIMVDNFNRDIIRRQVHSLYLNKEIPTLDKVMTVIAEVDTIPKFGRNTLWKLLKEIGFKYESHKKRKFLNETEEIICWRRQYLRSIKKFRSEGRTIFYLDETWLNEGHTVSKAWMDTNISNSRQAFLEGYSTGLNAPRGKGRRLIIAHIGSEHGFVENGLLDFVSKSTKDYHEEMTSDVFEDYFSQLLDFLPSAAVVVLDNASYHSKLVEKLPTTSWKKGDIKEWLQSKNISFDDTMLKTELLQIAKRHKLQYKRYVIDEMAKEKGITVLRLPPYHCQLNPIELIWAQVKGEVARNNTTFKLNDVRQLLINSFGNVTRENWTNAINHVKKEEERLWSVDINIEELFEPIVIPIGPGNESDSSSDEYDEMEADN